MQGAISGHLIRRTLHFAGNCAKHNQNQNGWVNVQHGDGGQENPLRAMYKRFQSPAAVITVGLTVVAFLVLSAAVEYSIRFVATNLAIVESTSDAGRIALSSSEPDAPLHKAPLLDDFDGEDRKMPALEAALPAQPITRKLRSTFQHLNSIGGFRSRFRGMRFAAFYLMATGFFNFIFQAIFSAFTGPGAFVMFLGNVSSALMCCNLHATWTHATIAAPSEKRFFQRFLPRSEAKTLLLPTLRLQLSIVSMHLLTVATGGIPVAALQSPGTHKAIAINLFLLPILTAIAAGLFLVLPAYIALIRTEASLLPEDMSAIVPFDRTFGGRVGSPVEGVSNKCAFACNMVKNFSMRGAYMHFGRETYRRVVKMQLKFIGIAMAMTLAFFMVLAAESYVIAGGEYKIREAAIFFYVKASRHENPWAT